MRYNASPKVYLIIIVRLVIIAVFLLFVWSLIRNLREMLKLDERLIKARQEIAQLENQQTKLSQDLTLIETGAFDEQQIRNKLGLVKPGEIVVLIPDDKIASSTIQPVETLKATPTNKKVWLQWLQLFF